MKHLYLKLKSDNYPLYQCEVGIDNPGPGIYGHFPDVTILENRHLEGCESLVGPKEPVTCFFTVRTVEDCLLVHVRSSQSAAALLERLTVVCMFSSYTTTAGGRKAEKPKISELSQHAPQPTQQASTL
jgi:hypothetical protein